MKAGVLAQLAATLLAVWSVAAIAQDATPLRSPSACLQLPVTCQVSSAYGTRRDPITGTYAEQFHHGVDFACPLNTPVQFSAAGTITTAQTTPVEGNYIGENTPDQFRVLYFHLNSFVQPTGLATSLVGKPVSSGDAAAFTGTTGRSTGPHLHFQLMDLTSHHSVNPLPLFCTRPTMRAGVMQGATPVVTDMSMPGRTSTPPSSAPPLPLDATGSLYEVTERAIATRAMSPDYLQRLATMTEGQLYAEIAYMEGILMAMDQQRLQSKERVEAMHALLATLAAEQSLAPHVAEQHKSAIVQGIR